VSRAQFLATVWLTSLLVSCWCGWEWRDRTADVDAGRVKVKELTSQVRAEESARATEQAMGRELALIGAKYEEDRTAAAAVPVAVVAGVRDGSLQLRDDLATCNTARLSEAVAGTIERDQAAQLRAEVAGALVQIGRDADDHLLACQAVIAADRLPVTP